MKKILSLSLILMLGVVSLSAKTSVDLTNTRLTNVSAQDNGDGSVTFSLTDTGSSGTIRFNDGGGDISAYQSVYFSYNQTTANQVTYSLNNQYVSSGRKNLTPGSTLQGASFFNIQELTDDQQTSSYFAISLKAGTGTVTVHNVFFTDKLTKQDETLLSQLTYSGGTSTVNAGIKINGSSKQNVVGPTSPSVSTYYDLSAYDVLKFELSFPTPNVGDEIKVRLQFINAAGDALEDVYVGADPTSSASVVSADGIYSFDLSDMPSKKLAGIKAWSDAGAAFTLTVADISVYNGTTVGITDNLIDDADKIVDVYNISGILVRKSVKNSEATIGLDKGIYIVGNKKVAVK